MAVRPLLVKILGDSTGAQAAFASLNKGMTTAGKKMTSAGRTMSRNVTLPIVAAGGAAVKLAIDYEQAFTRIAAVSNASASDIKEWRGEVLQMAGRTAQAPEELADALYFLASAGLKTTQIMPVLEASAKASAVGLGETADVARLTANALNAYEKSGLTAAQVTDTLVEAVKAGTAEPEEFAGALGRILPVASKAGIEFDQVTASLAQLSNVGLDVNEGVTAIRGAMLALLSPGTQAKDTLKEVGLTADQVRKTMSEGGIIEVFGLLEKATGGNIDKLRKIVPNVRALSGVFGLTEQKASKVKDTFDAVANSTGALDKAMKKTEKDSAFKLQKMMAQLKTTGIELGTDLLPIVLKIAKQIGKVAKAFTNMSPGAQDAAIKLALFVAVAGPLLRIVGPLVSGVGKLAGALRGVSAASTVAAGAKGAGGIAGVGGAAAGATGPILGVVAAFAGLAAQIVAANRKFDRLNEAVATHGSKSKEANKEISHTKKLFAASGGDAGTYALGLDAVNREVGESEKKYQAHVRAVTGSNTVAKQFNEIMSRAKDITGAQREKILNLVGGIQTLGGKIDSSTRSALNNVLAMGDQKRAIDILNGVIKSIPKQVTTKINVDMDAAMAALRGFREYAATLGADASKAHANAYRVALEAGSPSKVFIRIGKDVMAGFAIGLDGGQAPVRESFKKMEDYKEALVNHYRDLATKIKDQFSPIRDFFNTFKADIKSGFDSFGDLTTQFGGMKAKNISRKDLRHNIAVQSTQARRLAKALKKLARMGLNAETLSQLALGGAETIGLAEAMARAGKGMVQRTNRAQRRIDSYARSTAQVAGSQVTVSFQGDVYGFHDFEKVVMKAVNKAVKKKRANN